MVDKNELALAILLWRYVGHRLTGTGHRRSSPSMESERRAYKALKMAKELGVKDEYLKAVFSKPVVVVKMLEREFKGADYDDPGS